MEKLYNHKDKDLDYELLRICKRIGDIRMDGLSDPGADRILFWDNSEIAAGWLTVGGGLQLSGTTLSSVPPGATTQVIYNNAGAWGASANLTYDGSGGLTVSTKVKTPKVLVVADGTNAFAVYRADDAAHIIRCDTTNNRIMFGMANVAPSYTWHFSSSGGPMAVFQSTTTNNAASLALYNSSSYGFVFTMYGPTYAGAYAAYGLNYANMGLMRLGPNCSSMIIETYDLKPMCFGTNATERARFISTGQFGLGVTAPTAILHLKAGTTAASSAPIKLTSGTSMTNAEAGAIEFTTDDLFFTLTTGPTRKRILLAGPAGGLTSGRIPYATTNGRLTDAAAITTDGTNVTITGTIAGSNLTGTNTGDEVPIGTVAPWLKSFTNTPALHASWVECNGQTLSDAASVYNGQVIPNLNGDAGGAGLTGVTGTPGMFVRGGTTSGTATDDAMQGHRHNLRWDTTEAALLDVRDTDGATFGGFRSGAGGSKLVDIGVGNAKTDGTNGTPRVGTETKPVNYAVVWIIKVK